MLHPFAASCTSLQSKEAGNGWKGRAGKGAGASVVSEALQRPIARPYGHGASSACGLVYCLLMSRVQLSMKARSLLLLAVGFGTVALSGRTEQGTADSPPLSAGPSESLPTSLALVGATVIASAQERPLVNAVVLVRDGRIAEVGSQTSVAIPRGAKVLDCTGDTITAGFWNCHVHFTEPKWQPAADLPKTVMVDQLQAMLTRFGFTTAVDLGSSSDTTLAVRQRIESGEIPGPRLFTAGLPIYPAHGVPYYVTDTLPRELVASMPTPASPLEVVNALKQNSRVGIDLVKLFLVTGVRREGTIQLVSMDEAVAKAAVDEAHRQGKLVFAHPSTMKGLELAVAAGIDVLAHTIQDPGGWTDATPGRLKAAHVGLIPTLTLFSRMAEIEGVLHEVKSYAEVGGDILFGTDAGFLPDYAGLSREFTLLAAAGLTWQQILESLTTTPARRFGLADRAGQIAPGFEADLVVLAGDPTKETQAFTRVHYTVRAGRVLYTAPEMPEGPPGKESTRGTKAR